MNELIENVENLIKEIDNLDSVSKIKELNKRIEKDKELKEILLKYQYTKDENIKKDILNNELFKEYKEYETEINLIIMEINKKLKSINNKGKCCK